MHVQVIRTPIEKKKSLRQCFLELEHSAIFVRQRLSNAHARYDIQI